MTDARQTRSRRGGGGTVTIGSATLLGVDAVPVLVETSLRGEGSPRILGLVDAVVREAYHRVLAAFRACGVPSPRGHPTINFVPAGLRKSGTGFDLPMALSLAGAGGLFAPEHVDGVAAYGEVSLHGAILPVRGTLAAAIAVHEAGFHSLLVASRDAPCAAHVAGLDVIPIDTLESALLHLLGEARIAAATPAPRRARRSPVDDLADVRGHETPKLALVVAAAGGHNVLFAGPPGSGKSALMRRLPGLMPPPTAAEALEIARIHGTLLGSGGELPDERPFRAPHHSSSATSLLGGGPDLRPGEVTLAHRGVLFLDELPEFRREALEGLRQPLEDAVLHVGRARQTTTMPADVLLATAMNPCPCGWRGHPTRPCLCSPGQRHRYASRISGPLLDRIDIQLEVATIPPEAWGRADAPELATAALRERVLAAVARQHERCRRLGLPETRNARLGLREIERSSGGLTSLRPALQQLLAREDLSGRAHVRVLRIARTLADLDGRAELAVEDLWQAIRLRGFVRRQNEARGVV